MRKFFSKLLGSKNGSGYEGINIKSSGKTHDPIEFGNWEINFNYPFGFVVRNLKEKEEYHFHSKSDGWVTSRHTNKKSEAIRAYNTRSLLSNTFFPQTVLVDNKTTKTATRIMALQSKKSLDVSEKDELLRLTGLRKAN